MSCSWSVPAEAFEICFGAPGAVEHADRLVHVQQVALGASPGEVSALVLRQGLVVVAAGMAIGIAGAAAATQFMASLLYGISVRDPGTYAASAAVLLTVSAVATYLPARRAAAIDPAQSLRRQE